MEALKSLLQDEDDRHFECPDPCLSAFDALEALYDCNSRVLGDQLVLVSEHAPLRDH